MDELYTEIKQLIISSLALEDICAEDIETDAPLFGEGLGLDSIDALELVLGLKKKYGVVLEASDEKAREHLRSVATLAALIQSN